MPTGASGIDLHVYVGGGAALDHPGTLYSFRLCRPTFRNAFTYPPFAAALLYPLHLLPFGLVAFLWQAATIGALYGAIRISQRLPEARAGAAAVKLTPAIVRSSRQTPRLNRRRRPTLR